MQDEHRSLIDVEASEAAFEFIAIGEIDARIENPRRLRHRERLEPNLGAPPAAVPARFAIARMDEQPVEPGLEAIGIAQAVEASPGGHEGLLRSVLGSAVVAEDQSGGDVEPADRDARQLTERVVITRHRPLHEIPLHRGSSWRGLSGRTTNDEYPGVVLSSRKAWPAPPWDDSPTRKLIVTNMKLIDTRTWDDSDNVLVRYSVDPAIGA